MTKSIDFINRNLIKGRLKFERRDSVPNWARLVALAGTLMLSFLVTAVLLRLAGADLKTALISLAQGSFGDKDAIIDTLVKATPLILAGVAITVAFRGRVFNIGGEGQIFSGALIGYFFYTIFSHLPNYLFVPLVVLAGFIGGAICGYIPAVLKSRFKVDEVITTVMLNYIVGYATSLMLSSNGPWRDPAHFYQQSPAILDNAKLPILFTDTRLHAGLLVGLIASVLVYILLEKTPIGYEIRAIGSNPTAAKFKGINTTKTLVYTMVVSGGLMGIAGVGEVFGLHFRLRPEISVGYGFVGIIIALLASLNPLGVIPAAILFGGLANGAFRLQIMTGVPTALISVIQAVIIFFFLALNAVVRYRIRRIPYVE